MDTTNARGEHERWARLRFAVVGPLLASPPPRGRLRAELERLSQRHWEHPSGRGPVRFSVSTIERWYYQARAAHLLAQAGNPALITDALKDTLIAHAGGNPRTLTVMADALLASAAELDRARALRRGLPGCGGVNLFDALDLLAEERRQ